MLKKYTSILLIGGALAACNDTVPAGGQGYFDPPAPQVQQTGPINLLPDSPPVATSDADTTAALTEAVSDALNDTPPATDTPPPVPVPVPVPEPVPEPVPVPTPDPAVLPAGSNGISTDDGSLNLNAESFAEQEIKRNAAAALLAEARAKYTIIEPGSLPDIVAGVNIAEYARTTTNKLREHLYRRPVIKDRFSRAECRKFTTPDDAQRYFLANGGPQKDPLNLDPDGDGFACSWSPEPFRMLR